MVCTSFQHGHGKADFDRIGLEPVSNHALDKTGVRLDLGQLDRLVLPLRSHGKGGHGHGCDQSHDQNEHDNLSHIFLTFFVGSTTQMDGALFLFG